jgi:glycosyltransferase involved in cell wall biosynthesis
MDFIDKFNNEITFIIIDKKNNINKNYLEFNKNKIKKTKSNLFVINDLRNIYTYDNLLNKKLIIFESDILIYNWTKYTNRNNMYHLLDIKNIDENYKFKVYDSKKFIYLINKSYVNDFITNNINISLHSCKNYGVSINNIKSNEYYDLSILFIQQFDGNVFENYIKDIINKNLKIMIYIYYDNNIGLGRFEHKSQNVCVKYVNSNDIYNIISNNNCKKLYILYLPLTLIKNKNSFNKLMKTDNIEKYIFIAGTCSHMLRYLEYYKIDKIIVKGWSYKLDNYDNKTIERIYLKPEIFNLIKFRRYGYHKLQKKYVSISRFENIKNILFMIESFNEVIKNDPTVNLFIIGDGLGNIKKELNKYIIDNNVGNNIKLLGWMSKNDIYSFVSENIDYIVSTSITEGISGIILEGMFIGVPTIGSNILGNNEIIINNYNGLLFDYHNYKNIINNGKNLVSSINEYSSINKKNLVEKIYQSFNNEKYQELSYNCIRYINNMKDKLCKVNYQKIFNIDKSI